MSVFFSQPPPHPEPPLLPDGTINPAWFIWLYQLFQASTALQDLQKLETFDLTQPSETRALAAQRQAVLEGQPGISPLDLAQVRSQLATLGEAPVAAARLEEIKKLAWLMADGREPKRLYTGTHAQRLATYALSGSFFFETDTALLFVAVAGVWTAVSAAGVPLGAWTAFTTTITPSAGVWTPTSQDCTYSQIGKTVFVRLNVVGTLSLAAFYLNLTLPVAPKFSNRLAIAGVGIQAGSPVGTAGEIAGAGIIYGFRYDSTSWAAAALDLSFTGMYEAA